MTEVQVSADFRVKLVELFKQCLAEKNGEEALVFAGSLLRQAALAVPPTEGTNSRSRERMICARAECALELIDDCRFERTQGQDQPFWKKTLQLLWSEVVTGWLNTSSPEEVERYAAAIAQAHGMLRSDLAALVANAVTEGYQNAQGGYVERRGLDLLARCTPETTPTVARTVMNAVARHLEVADLRRIGIAFSHARPGFASHYCLDIAGDVIASAIHDALWTVDDICAAMGECRVLGADRGFLKISMPQAGLVVLDWPPAVAATPEVEATLASGAARVTKAIVSHLREWKKTHTKDRVPYNVIVHRVITRPGKGDVVISAQTNE